MGNGPGGAAHCGSVARAVTTGRLRAVQGAKMVRWLMTSVLIAFLVAVMVKPAHAERPPKPPPLSGVETPTQALEWMVATDRRGRHIGGILQATAGLAVGTLGLLNFAGAVDMSWGSTTQANTYFGSMTAIGYTAGIGGLWLRMRPNRYVELRGVEMMESGDTTDAQIMRYLEERAYTARRARIGSGLATTGFGVAAFLALESVSVEPLGGDSLRVSILFGTLTTLSGIAGMVLPAPEERLFRRLNDRRALYPAAQVRVSPTGLSVQW